MLVIAEAKIIEADPELHRANVEEDARKTGVWLPKPRPGDLVDEVTGEPATLRLSAKLPAGAVIRCGENLEDLGEAICDNTPPDADGNRPSKAECRLAAFEMLTTNPHQAVAFLNGLTGETSDEEPVPAPKPKRRPAKIVVHLTDRVLWGHHGVARVEGLGPVLLDQLGELLADRDLTVQPVIDLNTTTSVNGYEHPTAVKERTLLRTLGDVFPHSTSRGLARLDHDHATPYDPNGPPGQTGDHNDAPLTRKHHRAKTHQGYEVRQLGLCNLPLGDAARVGAGGDRERDAERRAPADQQRPSGRQDLSRNGPGAPPARVTRPCHPAGRRPQALMSTLEPTMVSGSAISSRKRSMSPAGMPSRMRPSRT
jgi:hypothetical protein